jgi:hypothetical protein
MIPENTFKPTECGDSSIEIQAVRYQRELIDVSHDS